MDIANPREADYLITIYELSVTNKEVRHSEIRKKLGVAKPTVSLMTKKLEKKGYIIIEKKKIKLTKTGLAKVKELLWRHGVLEVAFTLLGVDPEIACKMVREIELIIPTEVIQRIWETMGKPTVCPHGHEFPDIDKSELDEGISFCTCRPVSK